MIDFFRYYLINLMQSSQMNFENQDLLCDYNIKVNVSEQLNKLLVSLPKASAEYITSVPGEFDINRLLIKDIDKNKNIIMFDNKLLGVKINQFGVKPKMTAEEKESLPKYIQVSISDINKQYNIVDDKKTLLSSFKSLHKDELYPVTDTTNKWLTISYLVPYLLKVCPEFNKRVSLTVTQLLMVSYKYKELSLESLEQTAKSQELSLSVDSGSLTEKKRDKKSTLKQDVEQNNKFLVFQMVKYIIPRVEDSSKEYLHNQYLLHNNIINKNGNVVNHKDQTSKHNAYMNYYKDIKSTKGIYNPLDMLAVNAIIKKEVSIDKGEGTLSIINKPYTISNKVNNINSINNKQGKFDQLEAHNEYAGIKSKNDKYSLPYIDYIAVEINPSITMRNLWTKLNNTESSKLISRLPATFDKFKEYYNLATNQEFINSCTTQPKQPKKQQSKIEMPKSNSNVIVFESVESDQLSMTNDTTVNVLLKNNSDIPTQDTSLFRSQMVFDTIPQISMDEFEYE